MSGLFAFTIFLSAGLLFAIQPLFAKMILPLLGGSPAVWNTSMLFYQLTLLLGYGYSHLSSKFLKPKRQGAFHLLLLLVPLAVLPFAIPPGWIPPRSESPIPWLLALLAVSTGLPFFVLSTTSPLLQRWYSRSGAPSSHDPYFLYSASNFGSIVGLLGYPFLIEPLLGLKNQASWWTWSYVVFVVFCSVCFFAVARVPLEKTKESTKPEKALTNSERGRWILWAAIPSSLSLATTQYLTTEIATIPLFWVLPLALYLATFWLAFWRRPIISERRYRSMFSFFLPLLVAVMAARATQPIAALMAIHLATFFAAAGLFHGKLERSRPSAFHLTEFYFWIAVGGACGGIFNTLIAPAIFTGVLEYPLVLILAGLLMDPTDRLLTHKPNLADLLWPLALAGMIGAGVWMFGRYEDGAAQPAKFFLLFGLPAIVCFMFSSRAIRFALGVAFVLSASALIEGGSGRLYAARGFFGVHRVTLDPSGKFRELYHGSTLHGVQGVADSVCTPLTYYYPEGPLGQLMSDLKISASHSVGVVGLGAGSVACYMGPGQKVDFFEIDPIVEYIAKEPKYFSFLAQGKGETRIILGDARLTLGDQPPASYDLLILDAYSSDSVPVHLLTREALALYLSKLKPGGVLAFHVSQRHIDLGPVLKALAKDASLVLREQEHEPSAQAAIARATSSRWIALARDEASLKEIAQTPRWSNDSGIEGISEPWTDDYSSVVNQIKW